MKNLTGIKVKQWREDWDEVEWDPAQKRSEPQHWFYQFSIPASLLRAWSGVNARTATRKRGQEDLGIQRRHEPSRSEEIRQYVQYGYPWSELSDKKRQDPNLKDLRKPGWLPTAIVVNILGPKDVRQGKRVSAEDRINIVDLPNGLAELIPPKSYSDARWAYTELPPIEVIDGQHRLWAFDPNAAHDFDLPVVAFMGLDLSWQAYLFYTINIKPKKINPSLAFDLYPLLRTEDWLTKFEGHIVYRETRAQELVDLIWSYPESPWYQRINMLGETGQRGKLVTQASWVRALLATFVRSYDGPRVKLGGLFGSRVGSNEDVLSWSRIEQAAFLILLTSELKNAVSGENSKWAKALREVHGKPLFEPAIDPAFYGEHSLLSQDQGIRSFLHVANDLFFLAYEDIGLDMALADVDYDDEDDLTSITKAISALRKKKRIKDFVVEFTVQLALFDWRAQSAPGLTERERLPKAAFRGSGGYKELRSNLLKHLASYEGEVGQFADTAVKRLGY